MTKANVVYLYDRAGKIIYAANTLLEIRNEINRLNLLTYKEYINLKKSMVMLILWKQDSKNLKIAK